MSDLEKYHVVLGTGPLGIAVIEQLKQKGHLVKALNRSTPSDLPLNAPFVQSDALNLVHLKEVLKDAAVVYHCIGLPYNQWAEHFPKIMNNLISLAKMYQFKIVYADNLYAYGPQNKPLKEEMNYHPIGIKTKVRAEVANMLMNATKQHGIIATIGRGSDFYGPRVRTSILGERVFQHLLEDKPVELIGNPNKLHSHIYIKDFAKGLVILGEDQRANNEIWHIPHPPATTTKQLVEMVASYLNKKPTYKIANKTIVSFIGLFKKEMRHFKELAYQTSEDFVVNGDKFLKTFPYQNTDHNKAIQETLNWYRNQ